MGGRLSEDEEERVGKCDCQFVTSETGWMWKSDLATFFPGPFTGPPHSPATVVDTWACGRACGSVGGAKRALAPFLFREAFISAVPHVALTLAVFSRAFSSSFRALLLRNVV